MPAGGRIALTGHELKLQNGFGAWKQVRYTCLFDVEHETVVGVNVLD